jgi:hypothetical protein
MESNPFNMKMLGEAILHSSIQFAIGSVEMSSKFSVKNFSKDQETLQNAADALSDYLKIGLLWTIGVAILLHCNYGIGGTITAILTNALIIIWIYVSYQHAFQAAVDKYKLKMPIVKLL